MCLCVRVHELVCMFVFVHEFIGVNGYACVYLCFCSVLHACAYVVVVVCVAVCLCVV